MAIEEMLQRKDTNMKAKWNKAFASKSFRSFECFMHFIRLHHKIIVAFTEKKPFLNATIPFYFTIDFVFALVLTLRGLCKLVCKIEIGFEFQRWLERVTAHDL